jgi:pimeloyl-ACP methyl ester carboxylesterase
MLTVSVRHQSSGAKGGGESFWNLLRETNSQILPNTAGSASARDAINTACLARELFQTDLIKLEVIGDEANLQPDPFGLVGPMNKAVEFQAIAKREALNRGFNCPAPWFARRGGGNAMSIGRQDLCHDVQLPSLRRVRTNMTALWLVAFFLKDFTILSKVFRMNPRTQTIVLIHGLWMTPSSLDLFKEFFEHRGYHVIAPAWPRLDDEVDVIRKNPSALAGLGVLEIADHYDAIIRPMEQRPILVGHSLGGLIVQMLLDRGLGSAGVAIDATTPKGVFDLPYSMVRAARPVLMNPLNYWRTIMLTFEQFKHALANTMTDAEALRVYDTQVIPGPGRPIFQAVFANFVPQAATTVNRLNYTRAPLLLISATHDNLVPATLNEKNYQLYKHSTATTDYAVFADRSHLIVVQQGWQDVAEYAITWVERRLSGYFSRMPRRDVHIPREAVPARATAQVSEAPV